MLAMVYVWSPDELLWLTRNRVEFNKQSLKVALERGDQQKINISMASTTTVMSKYESTQELNQAKNVINAQGLENFSLTQELMALKAKLDSTKAQLAASTTTKTILIASELAQSQPPMEYQDLPKTGGQDTDVPLEHDPWKSWDEAGSIQIPPWYQSDLDKEMEKRNKHYPERDQESLLGGYLLVNRDRWQDSMRNHPNHRRNFIAKYKTITDYVEAPRELQKDPFFCPMPQKY